MTRPPLAFRFDAETAAREPAIFPFELRGEPDAATRSVEAVLSRETWVTRMFGALLLKHTAEAIDLTRAAPSLSLLFNHDPGQIIGRVEGIRLEGADLVGRLVLSTSEANPLAAMVWGEIEQGNVRGISVGGHITERRIVDEPRDGMVAERWRLDEVSVTPVQAITEAQIRHQAIGFQLNRDGAGDGEGGAGGRVTYLEEHRRRALDEGRRTGRQELLAQLAELDALFAPHLEIDGARELLADCTAQGTEPTVAGQMLLELIGRNRRPISSGSAGADLSGASRPTPRTSLVSDSSDRFAAAAVEALSVRSGLITDRAQVDRARQSEYLSLSMVELMRRSLVLSGRTPRGSIDDVIFDALRLASTDGNYQNPSSFPNIAADVANKALLRGWDLAEETWPQISRIVPLGDFKAANLVGLSGMSKLEELINGGGEMKSLAAQDRGEQIQLKTYAGKYGLTRRAIRNDDVQALSMVPMKLGREAAATIGDVVYAVLTGNPTMLEDGVALFHTATHGNLVASGGAAPSVTSLDAADTALGVQKDPKSLRPLNLTMSRLIVPRALKHTANVLATAENDPGASTLADPNPFRGTFVPVADARLDAASSTAWYASADPNLHDTIIVGLLDGNTVPRFRQAETIGVDGIQMDITMDCAAAPGDWRGLYKNAGAGS